VQYPHYYNVRQRRPENHCLMFKCWRGRLFREAPTCSRSKVFIHEDVDKQILIDESRAIIRRK
jgi:hypothetical protein